MFDVRPIAAAGEAVLKAPEYKVIPSFGLWIVRADDLLPEIRDRFPSWPLAPFIAWPALEDEA